jgi:iron complex outermembrane receptor protein
MNNENESHPQSHSTDFLFGNPMIHATFRRSALHSAIVVLLSASSAAHAQSAAPAAAAASATDSQTVVVRASADASADGLKAPYAGGQVARGGRVGVLGSEDVMDTPFNITNYTSKLIQDQQALSIADVLQNDPAVRTARGYGNFQQLYMIRGLPVYSDDMSYNGLYGLLPRQYLSAEFVERVEVLRGSSAFLNGAAPGGSGLGGAVNVMPKRAPNEDLNEVTLGADSGGQFHESIDLARRYGPEKNLGVRLNVINTGGDSVTAGEKDKVHGFLLGADFHTGDFRVSADIGSQYFKLTSPSPSITVASGVAIPRAPDANKQLGQPWTYSEERDVFGTVRAEYDLASNVTAWAAAGFRNGKESNNLSSTSVTDDAGTLSVTGFQNSREDAVRSGEVGLRGRFTTGSVGHTLVGSIGAYSLDSKNAYAFDNLVGKAAGTLSDPVAIAMPAEDVYVGGKLDDPLTTARTNTNSIALADSMSLLDDRVLFTLGARRQQIKNASYDYNTGAESTGADKTAKITPVAGLVFKASKQVSLYATYIEGLVAGDIAPTEGYDNTGAYVTVSNAGEVFKTYTTRQGEIGVKVDTGRYGGTVSVYQSRKPTASIVGGVYGVNTQQRNRGAELSVYGEAAPGVRLLGGLSFLDTHMTGAAATGEHAIGAPREQFNIGTDWDVPGVIGLALNARAVHTGSQYADSANTQVLPSWNRFDIGGRYTFDVGSKVITLRAAIDNVANRNYWASAGGYPGYGYLVEGATRSLRMSGTVAF